MKKILINYGIYFAIMGVAGSIATLTPFHEGAIAAGLVLVYVILRGRS